MSVIHKPFCEMRTSKDLSMRICGYFIRRNVDAYIGETFKYLDVTAIPPLQHLAKKTSQRIVLRIDPKTKEMELVVSLAWFYAELYARKAHRTFDGRTVLCTCGKELSDTIAIVMIRERHRIKVPGAPRKLRGRDCPIACRTVYMEIDHCLHT